MARRDDFDDDEGFLDSILNRRERAGVHPGSLRRVLAVTAGLAVLGILSAVLYSTWPEGRSEISDAAVPIIRADATPYKTAPDEPGGMAVPNKDSTIFDTLKGEQAGDSKTENLFEDSEKPVRKEDVFTPKDEAAAATPSDPARDAVVSKMPVMSKPVVTYESPESSEATPPVDVQASTPLTPEKTAAVEPSPDKTAAKKADAIQPAAGGNFYVQMAAVKSESDAKAQWPKYQAQFSELSALPLRVQSADLGAKGTYYRIQGGPVSEADARKLCSSINAQKAGSCVVAKR